MVTGIMRVKNESRWIERCVRSILPVCDQVIVMDDHSTDDTYEICHEIDPRVSVHMSPFTGLDETRDKNWLLEKAAGSKWIVSIDGDEMLAPGDGEKLIVAMKKSSYPCLSLRVLYLWDSENSVRVDGVYGDFHRESVFRPNGFKFYTTSAGGNFHCGNVPQGIRGKREVVDDITLFHFGYMYREDRVRKYHWYNLQDPGNKTEDGYRHIVIGDLFPAESRFNHGGPLKMKRLEELCSLG